MLGATHDMVAPIALPRGQGLSESSRVSGCLWLFCEEILRQEGHLGGAPCPRASSGALPTNTTYGFCHTVSYHYYPS